MAEELSLAVVTGGHAYDVRNFQRLFRRIGEGWEVCIQHMEDFACSPREVREGYDVVLFYIMLMEGPSDEGLPWYAGKPRTALSELGETEQGIVVLHHALLAYPEWSVWSEIVGIEGRGFGYHIGETVESHVADPEHPITRGLSDWTMTDETYEMADAGEGSRVLITYDHPRSMRDVAWTRQYGKSRVFSYQAGHDEVTWQDPSFQEVLRRGIEWCAGRP